ncbi:uncharacterized protein [Spinacia oleracea]|uniref:Sulfatase N-terminal domain-containing protein n=1 Tax=Spinacia oleracea TaxID=3562 RepID=A0ABM3QT02_SPIOL|nr:uncharacterized protein LOC130462379 [Spinacia oleracea]
MIDIGGNPDALDRLDPNGLWFDNDHKVSNRVTESVKKFYNGPWTSFSNFSACSPGIWFRNFRHYYRWDPLISQEVRSAFVLFREEAANNKANLILFLADNEPSTSLSWCPG